MEQNIEYIKNNNLVLFECLSGSHAFGTNTENSDIDKKGIFILPKSSFYGFKYIEQINDSKYDIVYYEIKKFIEMLLQNNPNALEILATSGSSVIYRHELFELLDIKLFLSKRCKDSFAGYAYQQIKKSRGENKKIVNPMDETKKTAYDFCYILQNNGSVNLPKWLKNNDIDPDYCGLSRVDHMRDLYVLYYDKNKKYNGIWDKNSFALNLSSIPKEESDNLKALLYYNEDGYKTYCKKYSEYWDWVKNRNENRFNVNTEHGKNYDSKNMSHCFRLIDEAQEIAINKTLTVKAKNRDFLMRIKAGEFDYDYLVNLANEKLKETEEIYKNSDLPDKPDYERAENILVKIREKFYQI